MSIVWRSGAFLLALLVATAAHAKGPGRADILVLAPHPDDESLMAAAVLADAAKQGKRVVVAYATNGDFGCERNGFVREREALAALAVLGVPANHVYFLGYPDGHLAELGAATLAPLARRDAAAACTSGNTTYAANGADLHSVLTGSAATYTAGSLVGDLAMLLEHVRPRDIYVSHPLDHHLDHAFTYAYLRRALEHLPSWRPTGLRVHRALVHFGGCWPNASTPPGAGDPRCPAVQFAPAAAWPELPSPYQRYRPNEQRASPWAMRSTDPEHNPKFQAIAAHATQTGPRPPLSYLFGFARRSEPFWSERLGVDSDGTLRRERPAHALLGQIVPGGEFAATERGYEQPVLQRAPLRCSVFADASTSAMTLRFLVRKGVGYTLRIEPDAVVLVHEPERELRRWPIPAEAAAAHAYSVSVDPRADENGIAELTVRRDWEILGVAVDVAPLLEGAELGVSVDPKRSRPRCRPW